MMLPPSLGSLGDEGEGRACGDAERPFWPVTEELGVVRSFCVWSCLSASINTSTPSELFLRVQNDPLIFFLNGRPEDAMLSWLGVAGLFVGGEFLSIESSDNLG